jgi:hypothetical protein
MDSVADGSPIAQFNLMTDPDNLHNIFSHFNYPDFDTIRCVCRIWNLIGNHISFKIPPVGILDSVIANNQHNKIKRLLTEGATPSANTLELIFNSHHSNLHDIDLLLLAAIDNGVSPLQSTIEKTHGFLSAIELLTLMNIYRGSPTEENKEKLRCKVEFKRKYLILDKQLANLGMRIFLNNPLTV